MIILKLLSNEYGSLLFFEQDGHDLEYYHYIETDMKAWVARHQGQVSRNYELQCKEAGEKVGMIFIDDPLDPQFVEFVKKFPEVKHPDAHNWYLAMFTGPTDDVVRYVVAMGTHLNKTSKNYPALTLRHKDLTKEQG